MAAVGGGTNVGKRFKAALAAVTISLAAGATAPNVNAAASDHKWRNIRLGDAPYPVRVVGSSCNDTNEYDVAKTQWNTMLVCNKYVPVPGKPGQYYSKRHWTYLRHDLWDLKELCTADGFYFPASEYSPYQNKTYKPSECRIVN